MIPVAARIVNDVSICTSVGRAQLVLGKSACGGGDSFQCLYQKFLLAPAQPVLLLRTLSLPILFVRNFKLGWPTNHVIFPVLGCKTCEIQVG